MVSPPSFLDLMEQHRELDRCFLCHQEALLDRDIERARERLAEFERLLVPHMRGEDERLIPVYQRAGATPGTWLEYELELT